MKKLIAILTLLSAFAAHATDLQLHECSFGQSSIEFTPSAALTALLKEEVKGAVVYKVKYKRGSTVTGPKTDLAVIDDLPNKSLAVSFFEHDEEDGIVYSKSIISIYLTSPIATQRPLIIFSSSLYNEIPVKGKCSLTL